MKIWTCNKCGDKFTPVTHERYCSKHKNTSCVECGKLFENERADKQRCISCAEKHNLGRIKAAYWKNKEKKQAYDRSRRELHPGFYRQAARRFRENNPGSKNADTQLYRALKRQACPAWANRFFMAEAYRLAELRTKILRTRWVVDHIVPLRHPLVCGLHVEHNLQVVPEAYNLQKSNSFHIS